MERDEKIQSLAKLLQDVIMDDEKENELKALRLVVEDYEELTKKLHTLYTSEEEDDQLKFMAIMVAMGVGLDAEKLVGYYKCSKCGADASPKLLFVPRHDKILNHRSICWKCGTFDTVREIVQPQFRGK